MYKVKAYRKTKMTRNTQVEGETIEHKVGRLLSNKEPIEDGAPLIYTERKDGVLSAYNIRTDRWEVAADAMDLVERSKTAKRAGLIKGADGKIIDKDGNVTDATGKIIQKKSEAQNKDGKAESTQGKKVGS